MILKRQKLSIVQSYGGKLQGYECIEGTHSGIMRPPLSGVIGRRFGRLRTKLTKECCYKHVGKTAQPVQVWSSGWSQGKYVLENNACHSLSPDSLKENVQCSSQKDHIYEVDVDPKSLDCLEIPFSHPEEPAITLCDKYTPVTPEAQLERLSADLVPSWATV